MPVSWGHTSLPRAGLALVQVQGPSEESTCEGWKCRHRPVPSRTTELRGRPVAPHGQEGGLRRREKEGEEVGGKEKGREESKEGWRGGDAAAASGTTQCANPGGSPASTQLGTSLAGDELIENRLWIKAGQLRHQPRSSRLRSNHTANKACLNITGSRRPSPQPANVSRRGAPLGQDQPWHLKCLRPPPPAPAPHQDGRAQHLQGSPPVAGPELLPVQPRWCPWEGP